MRLRAVVLFVVAGCGRFHFGELGPRDALGDDGADADPGDVGDAVVMPPVGTWWITTLERDIGNSVFVTRPLDDGGIGTPCPEISADGAYYFALGHPTLPYVYMVGPQLEGLALACTADAVTPVAFASSSTRNFPRAVLDVDAGVGFFTLDGPGSTGVYRFTIDAAGVPTGDAGSTSPTGDQPLVLDPPGALYGAGPTGFEAFILGSMDTVSVGPTVGGACNDPVDLALTGTTVDTFCGDAAAVQRNQRDPAAPTVELSTTAMTGPFDAAVAISGDRVVAAILAPPQLVVIHLNSGGEPTVIPGPMLPARVDNISVTADSQIVVAVWPPRTDNAQGTIGAWSLVGDQLVQIDQQMSAATNSIDAIAITHAP